MVIRYDLLQIAPEFGPGVNLDEVENVEAQVFGYLPETYMQAAGEPDARKWQAYINGVEQSSGLLNYGLFDEKGFVFPDTKRF